MSMTYPKISGPYLRNPEDPSKLLEGSWVQEEFEILKDAPWKWSEKVDGTNIRVVWDGHKPEILGRTDKASIPGGVFAHLQEKLPGELLENVFGETPAILFGEGFGAGIQSGGNYRPDQSFILFDVYINGFWLLNDDVWDIGSKLNIPAAPFMGTMTPLEAIRLIKSGELDSTWEDAPIEGIVGTAPRGMLMRAGKRIQMKVKVKDFKSQE